MLLRTESDFIFASNISYDLAGIVTTYLNLYRKYVNGHNNVTVPDTKYMVSFNPTKKEGFIDVVLHWTDHHTYTETLYYDSDSDYFSEAWGADNSYGETSHTEDFPKSAGINIPIKHLMMNEEQMLKHFEILKNKIAQDKAEAIRNSEIIRLTKQLEELREGVYEKV